MAASGFLILILNPLQRLFRPKNVAISFEFFFYPSFCYISEEFMPGEDRDRWLIIAYICYVARYFHICDDRQRGPMAAAYASLYKLKEVDYTDFIGFIEGEVFKTLNEQEKKAKIALFTAWSPPPYMLADAEQRDTKRLGKYSYRIALDDTGGIRSHLMLSFGMDKILLPHSLALFHEYVVENLSSAKHRSMLNKLSLEILITLENAKPTAAWEQNITTKVLANNDLLK